MGNLIRQATTLELCAWLDADDELPDWDALRGCPFPAPEDCGKRGTPAGLRQTSAVQSYFAEYHLEVFRQRHFNHFPSRLHALLLFATQTDAENFRAKNPGLVYGKHLVRARTQGAYLCSFHDASWLDYMRLPHSLDFAMLDQLADHYWSGRTVEEIGLSFLGEPWREPPVIEALFQGHLQALRSEERRVGKEC